MMDDDMTLVREFAASRSDAAFAALVERHIGLVHSAALRQADDAHLAGDITQAVFIILARKAASLGPKTVLSAWLYRATRYAASDALRARRRRQIREQEAFMQSTLNSSGDAPSPSSSEEVWQQLAPLLDDAMHQLGEKDRTALVLRYFENKTAREIAAALRIGEEAAQKRLARALEKLRQLFAKHGVDSTAAAITSSIAANSIQLAPVDLAAAVAAAAKGAAASTSTLTLVKGALKIMAWTKTKTTIVAGLAVLLATGTTVVIIHRNERSMSPVFQMRLVSNVASSNSKKMVLTSVDRLSGRTDTETLDVQKKVLLDQSAIQSASVNTNSSIGQPVITVDFELSPTAATQFAKLTRENIGRRLAIIVDGKVISAPVIRSEIPGGRGKITGDFTLEEANRLAELISNPDSK